MEDNQNSEYSSLISLIEVSENEAENGDDNRLISLIEIDESDTEEEKCGNVVKLTGISRVVRNWRKCFACNEKQNLCLPSKKMRQYFCKSKKIYIQKNDRVCKYHFQCQNWNEIRPKTASNFSSKILDEMIAFLIDPPLGSLDSHIEIGVTDAQFKQIIYELGLPENPNKNQKRMILAVRLYLERLRHGHTFAQMAHQHNVDRRTIAKKIKSGRDILLNNFVPVHLGHQTRQWLIQHTTDLARLLYCENNPEKCVIICDGTYIYTCGSSNYSHQRKIYSGQKRRHLFKIMKMVSVDGSIIDVFGPFPATKNDAEILRNVFEQTSFQNILNSGDVILLDRGFRDCKKYLENKKFVVKMPEFITKGTHGQLTAKQGNKSRLTTKMRYAIEVANGRMKNKWHLFEKIIPSILTPHLMSDYKIGAAVLNAFGKAIICDKEDFFNIGSRMIGLVDMKNELTNIIHSKSFKRTERLYFQSIEASHLNFPRFNREQLKNFSLGTYAIKQAISYTAEHRKLHGQFKISILSNEHVLAHFNRVCAKKKIDKPMFISAKIKSRFRSQKTHSSYILYDSSAVDIEKFLHYCECQHGQRTAGCCAHVMSIVWYFGYGQYETAKDPASHLNDFFNHI